MVAKKRITVSDILIYTFLTVFTLTIVLPIYYVVVTSLSTYEEYIKTNGLILFPKRISLEGYTSFLSNPAVLKAYVNTAFITVVGTLINMVLTILMAYPLSRKDLPGKKFLTIFILIPMVLSGGLIPTYFVVKTTGLVNSIWSMIIPSAIWSHNLIIMKSFFTTIDESFIEAGKLDGANEWYILIKIILPLSKAVIATLTLFYGVGHWNEYYAALYYITDSSKYPLQVILRSILAASMNSEASAELAVNSHSMKMASVVLSALPIMVVYPFLQKYFAQGVLLGGIKG